VSGAQPDLTRAEKSALHWAFASLKKDIIDKQEMNTIRVILN
jgi:hypothetical protein